MINKMLGKEEREDKDDKVKKILGKKCDYEEEYEDED